MVRGAMRWFAEVLKVDAVPGLDEPGIDFPSLAKGYGVESVRTATADDLKQALTAALGSQAPTLIEGPPAPRDSDFLGKSTDIKVASDRELKVQSDLTLRGVTRQVTLAV